MTTLDGNRAPIQEAVDAGLISGAVTAVWRAGEVLQVNTVGHRDVEAGLPMQRDTIFRIASMTKPITTAAAMTLADEGKLALDDEITQWLPEFGDMRVLDDPDGPLDKTGPARRPITVEDLMTHRSGLAYGFSVGGPISHAYERLRSRHDPDTWLQEVAALPLVHQPGERMTYSVATDVLGILISRISGRSLNEVLSERICGPLNMTDTGFCVPAAARHRAATMYWLDDKNRLHNDAMGPPPVTPPAFCGGGSGLWSTADDYLRFAVMLLREGTVDGTRVLSADSARLMRTDRLTAEQKRHPFLGAPHWVGRGFGLGVSVVTDPAKARPLFGPGGLGTFGWPGAYGTWWQADPTGDVILIYLIQNFPMSAVDAEAVSGNTSQAKLQSTLPKFVRLTYRALAA